MSLGEHVREVLKEWEADPSKMFDWRSNALKMSLLVLEHIIEQPEGRGRSQDLARIRAIAQLQNLTVAMETMRIDVPVVCPNCNTEFNLK